MATGEVGKAASFMQGHHDAGGRDSGQVGLQTASARSDRVHACGANARTLQMLSLPRQLGRVGCKCSLASSVSVNKQRSRTNNQNNHDRHTQICF